MGLADSMMIFIYTVAPIKKCQDQKSREIYMMWEKKISSEN